MYRKRDGQISINDETGLFLECSTVKRLCYTGYDVIFMVQPKTNWGDWSFNADSVQIKRMIKEFGLQSTFEMKV